MLVQSNVLAEEYIDVIDSKNKVIGIAKRSEIYLKRQSHRIVHVMVMKGSEVLITRRSFEARYLPGVLCTSAGGHVAAGESTEEAAERELEEEIGLRGSLRKVGEMYFKHDFEVHLTVFAKAFEESVDRFVLSPREVEPAEFVNLQSALKFEPNLVHPQLPVCLKMIESEMLGEF